MLFLFTVLIGVITVGGQGTFDQNGLYNFGSQIEQSQFKPQRVTWFTPPPRFDVGQGCLHGGAVVPMGQSVPSIDGCNRCFCISAGGIMACTKRYCTETSGCHVGGSVFKSGGRFLHADGCNTCTCLKGRKVNCTNNYWCPSRSSEV